MKGIVKLVYTKVIDAGSAATWDKHVFEDTHKEFFIQAQRFDQQGRYETFQEILENIPKAGNIHSLVSTAAFGHLRQLNGRFPDVRNTLGKTCVPFNNFKFEIVQSHIKNKALHKIAIHLYSDSLLWIDTIDKHFIFGTEEDSQKLIHDGEIQTHSIILLPNVGIASFRRIKPTAAIDSLVGSSAGSIL